MYTIYFGVQIASAIFVAAIFINMFTQINTKNAFKAMYAWFCN